MLTSRVQTAVLSLQASKESPYILATLGGCLSILQKHEQSTAVLGKALAGLKNQDDIAKVKLLRGTVLLQSSKYSEAMLDF